MLARFPSRWRAVASTLRRATRVVVATAAVMATGMAIATATATATAYAQMAPQNPSPMAESTRRHERLVPRPLEGESRQFPGPGGRPVDLLVPKGKARGLDVVIHFHGTSWLPLQAIEAAMPNAVGVVLNLGSGSGAYHRPFIDPLVFDTLLDAIAREVRAARGAPVELRRVTLVGFSAGHGAIRAIIREPRHFARVDAILLLDGMHTSYVPEGQPMASGGVLDTTNLAAFAEFARAASRGEKRFLVTHSEIFPGTFASTTETADWILAAIGRPRRAVLKWGPRGLQQLSEVRAGRFELLGFAGNSAPDHVDQLHGMPEFLRRLRG